LLLFIYLSYDINLFGLTIQSRASAPEHRSGYRGGSPASSNLDDDDDDDS